MASTPTIEELLRATAASDRGAFRDLYDRTAAKLFGVAMRICRDRALAEDAIQETYAEIWGKAANFDASRGAGLSWMSVIARSRAIDVIRRRGRGGEMADDKADEKMLAMPDLSRPTDGGVESMALAACLEALDDRERRLVLLAYNGGYSREELAGHFDAPVNTIKTWLRRALLALRGCLEQ